MTDTATVTTGIAASLLLMVFFLYSQKKGAKFLELPTHWLGIAVLPFVAALFAADIITSFDALGFRIEKTVNKQVEVLSENKKLAIRVKDRTVSIKSDPKESLEDLEKKSASEKERLESLIFVEGDKHNYDVEVVEAYRKQLPNLEYFELRNRIGNFLCIIPQAIYGKLESLDSLVSDLKNDRAQDQCAQYQLSTISNNVSLLDALRKLNNRSADRAAVLDEQSRFAGILLVRDIESLIAKTVLEAADS